MEVTPVGKKRKIKNSKRKDYELVLVVVSIISQLVVALAAIYEAFIK